MFLIRRQLISVFTFMFKKIWDYIHEWGIVAVTLYNHFKMRFQYKCLPIQEKYLWQYVAYIHELYERAVCFSYWNKTESCSVFLFIEKPTCTHVRATIWTCLNLNTNKYRLHVSPYCKVCIRSTCQYKWNFFLPCLNVHWDDKGLPC